MGASTNIAAAVIAAGLGLTTAASADPAAADGQIVFKYDIADLGDQQTAAALYHRLIGDAGAYCDYGAHHSPAMHQALRDCQDALVEEVVDAISDRRLSRIHARKRAQTHNPQRPNEDPKTVTASDTGQPDTP